MNSGARLVNQTTGETLATRARIARGWWEQLVGLIGRTAPEANTALGLPRCAVIHTVGVAGALDVAFCDRAGRVLCLVAGVRPWRVAGGVDAGGAAIAWEARAGTLAGRARPGDVLALEAG